MPPNERRIVHLTLRDNPDVTTESNGEGNRRRSRSNPRAVRPRPELPSRSERCAASRLARSAFDGARACGDGRRGHVDRPAHRRRPAMANRRRPDRPIAASATAPTARPADGARPRRGDRPGHGPAPPTDPEGAAIRPPPPRQGPLPAAAAAASTRPPRGALDPGAAAAPCRASRTPQYLVIGHICADLLPDGSVVLGGTALYSALTAARLGWRVGVLTRGAFGRRVAGIDIPSLEEFADEISIVVQDADVADHVHQRLQRRPPRADHAELGRPDRPARPAAALAQRPRHPPRPDRPGDRPEADRRPHPAVPRRHAPGLDARLAPRDRRPGHACTHLGLPPELLGRIDGVVVSDEEISLARDSVEQVGARRLGVITKGEHGARDHLRRRARSTCPASRCRPST